MVVTQNIEKWLIRGVNYGGRITAKDQALISSKLLFLKRNLRRVVNWYADEQKALITEEARAGGLEGKSEGGGPVAAAATTKEESEAGR